MTTKKDLVKKLNNRIDYLNKEDISEAIDHVFDYIKSELANNNRIEIRGFGSFSLRARKKAGQDQKYNSVYYRMSKNMLKLVNEER